MGLGLAHLASISYSAVNTCVTLQVPAAFLPVDFFFIVGVFSCGTCTHSCGYVYMTVRVHMHIYVVHVEVKGQCQLPS